MITKATIKDLEELYNIESLCFPINEAASKETIEKRLNTFNDYFYILKKDNKIVSFINGILSNEKNLIDKMYEDSSYHNINNKWYIIFGVDTLPNYQH